MQTEKLCAFRDSVRNELFDNIIPFWIDYTRDNQNGGFYGRITNNLQVERKASKSLILMTRILWTFSALYKVENNPEFLMMARRAYKYLIDKFFDKKYGGVFWLVDYQGNVVDDKKKIYGQAFSIYALAEYYGATNEKKVLEEAVSIFNLIEKNNYDFKNRGYFETSNRNWTIAEELRLSAIDMDEMKSMNTHLHLMEAYTNLYRVWKDDLLKSRLIELVNDFLDFIIDSQTNHFRLFFDEHWQSKSNNISFGHDIEGSWLLCEAADLIGNRALIQKVNDISIKMVDSTMKEGFNDSYAIYAERNSDGSLDKNCHFWQQAEAIVGLINVYYLTKNERYFEWTLKCWDFILDNFVDREHGEWFYEITSEGKPDQTRYKVSEWKGPYHSCRACMETLRRTKE